MEPVKHAYKFQLKELVWNAEITFDKFHMSKTEAPPVLRAAEPLNQSQKLRLQPRKSHYNLGPIAVAQSLYNFLKCILK